MSELCPRQVSTAAGEQTHSTYNMQMRSQALDLLPQHVAADNAAKHRLQQEPFLGEQLLAGQEVAVRDDGGPRLIAGMHRPVVGRCRICLYVRVFVCGWRGRDNLRAGLDIWYDDKVRGMEDIYGTDSVG